MPSFRGVQQRLPSLLDPAVLFAHRGARAHAPENTIEAFQLALRLGATGLESDVWLTADGVPVLDHDGVIRRGIRKLPIAKLRREELPGHIPSVQDLLAECGTEFDLSLDVKDSAAALPTAQVCRRFGVEFTSRVWLCHWDLDTLSDWRTPLHDFRLVDSTRLERVKEGPERRAALLASRGIDAVNLHRSDWNGGLVVLFHRFDRLAFSWDVQFEHQMEPALRMGLDAVYSDDVEMMHSVARGA